MLILSRWRRHNNTSLKVQEIILPTSRPHLEYLQHLVKRQHCCLNSQLCHMLQESVAGPTMALGCRAASNPSAPRAILTLLGSKGAAVQQVRGRGLWTLQKCCLLLSPPSPRHAFPWRHACCAHVFCRQGVLGSANQPVTATRLGVMAEKPEHGGGWGAPTVITRGAKVRLVRCIIGHLHILFDALHETPSVPFNLSIYTFFSLLLAAVRDVYNSINGLLILWTERGEAQNTKQPSNNIKRTHLFHLVFVCWHPSRAYWSWTVFILVKCVCGSKRKENPPEIRQLKIQKVVSCAPPNSLSARSNTRFY